ncbi:hypothetical protein ACFPES_35600 [Paenibacillus sp. GCM10023248]|uniref:hypothetical protein n=1 Tax=unclassified Paenibacillus TaxID=185978 RepID=UPI00237980EB|nr:hypothetical protein [Paenibacillus sp. MAHUQ-63]MDD9272306.1 hypothetical protein [Paenibacillus sp. MAHUQ-63]
MTLESSPQEAAAPRHERTIVDVTSAELPDRVASFCELLPLTPVVTLVRGGWAGNLSGYEALGALATAMAWILIAVFAVRRWFRWEPRR